METIDIWHAKQVSIVTILQQMGLPTKKYGGNYKAPWRSETKGSLKIYPKTNTWCDFGEGNSTGDSIDFYRRIRRCDFTTAVRELCMLANSPVKIECASKVNLYANQGFRIHSKGEIKDKWLCLYAYKRCIDSGILNKYCVELTYSPRRNPAYKCKAIGFMNDSGQYEMSGYNAKRKEKIKLISGAPKDITSFMRGNSRLLIFEGFFNMMSLFSMPAWKPYTERYDVIVLNSVGNTNKAIEKLSGKRYEKVGFFLDADKAGKGAMQKLSQSIQSDEKRDLFRELFFDRYPDFCASFSAANRGKVADLNDIWRHLRNKAPHPEQQYSMRNAI